MKISRPQLLLLLALIFTISAVLFFTQPYLNKKIDNHRNSSQTENSNSDPLSIINPTISSSIRETAVVAKAIDGDSILLTNGEELRYIGIDAPEFGKDSNPPECYATKSAHINRQLVEGQTIEIEKDISDKDIYNRLLRYVWVENIFINDFLIRQGFARKENVPPDEKYKNQLLQAEKEARENNRGLWKECY